MPISPSLSRKLRETLGKDAGDDLVTWLEDQRQQSAQLRADLAELETTMNRRFDRLEANLTARIAETASHLMKWSFVFWCGAVAAIAALAGVLRT